MFWFVRIFVLLALAATVVISFGFLLPEERSAVKTTLIDAPPDRVYRIVTDVENQAAWRSSLRHLQVERRGELWAWTEDQTSGAKLKVEELVRQPLQRYEFKFTSSQGIQGHWVSEFETSNEGRTKLTFTQKVVIENPLRRAAAFVMLNLDTLMDQYLGDLNRYASQPESTVDPMLRPSGSPPIAKDSATTPEPSPSATPLSVPPPSATVLSATPSPTSAAPSPTPSIPTPSTPVPSVLVPTPTASGTVVIPGPSISLPPNTPSLPSPPPSATAVPSPTATGTASPTP